jgi:glutathione S-transferase
MTNAPKSPQLTITTFRSVPPLFQGYVRDLRLRWACEEAGLPYSVRLVGREEVSSPEYRRQQPFGQVPVMQDGELTLFETGSIVLHLSQYSEALLPLQPAERARATSWIFAALNSIEPHVPGEHESTIATRKRRLEGLSAWLEGREYLENGFTAADLIMATVLRDLPDGVLETFPTLFAYHERCVARPGFKKALADQLKLYEQQP